MKITELLLKITKNNILLSIAFEMHAIIRILT